MMQSAKTSVFDDVSYRNILNENKNKRTRSCRIRHWVFMAPPHQSQTMMARAGFGWLWFTQRYGLAKMVIIKLIVESQW